MKRIPVLCLLTLLLLTLLTYRPAAVTAAPNSNEGFWQVGYRVDVAYWQGVNPHYGAFFSGINGSSQFFTGATGQPAGYASWNWWGNNLNVLLLEKRWLLAFDCGGYQCSDRWTGSNHHAWMNQPPH